MSRVMTFSRTYPAYHPKRGQQTFFVEKMIQWYWDNVSNVMQGYHNVPEMLYALNHSKFPKDFYQQFSDTLNPEINEWKSHTIRGGHWYKPGDFFRPCIWTGAPYNSPQMQFLPALSIPKTWDFDINGTDFYLDGRHQFALTGDGFDFDKVASNDGLNHIDLNDWFTKSPDFKKKREFNGQIICWNEKIEY
jgi:hypothetical protein